MITQVDTIEESTMWQTMRTEMNEAMLPELTAMLVPVYEKYLTQSDLEALIAFYNTPAGKKYANSQSKITKESFQVGQKWGEKVAARVMQKTGND
jgi:hypothetical protein